MLYRPETQAILVKHTYREIQFSQHAATTGCSTTLAGQDSMYARTVWGFVCMSFPASPPAFPKTPPEQVLIRPSLSPQLLALNPTVAPPDHPPTPLTACRDQHSLFPESKNNVFLPLLLRSIVSQKGKSTYPYLIKINVTSEHHTEVLLLNLVFKERENPISFILSIFAKVYNSY